MFDGTKVVEDNLDKIKKKIEELETLSKDITESLRKIQGDHRKKMAFAELLKALLEIEKTSLAYIKESNAMALKLDKSLAVANKDDDTLNKLLVANINALQTKKTKEDK